MITCTKHTSNSSNCLFISSFSCKAFSLSSSKVLFVPSSSTFSFSIWFDFDADSDWRLINSCWIADLDSCAACIWSRYQSRDLTKLSLSLWNTLRFCSSAKTWLGFYILSFHYEVFEKGKHSSRTSVSRDFFKDLKSNLVKVIRYNETSQFL